MSESIARDGELQSSEKSWLITLLWFLFLGLAGAHRFYIRRVLAGVIRLCVLLALVVVSMITSTFSFASLAPQSFLSFFSLSSSSSSSWVFFLLYAAIFVLIVVDCVLIAKGQLKDGEGKSVVNPDAHIEGKKWSATALLAVVLGIFGAHRFYVGKIGTGIVWILTLGVFGIGWLVDIVTILLGAFRDKRGAAIRMPRVAFSAE